jgi:hypothetical protein
MHGAYIQRAGIWPGCLSHRPQVKEKNHYGDDDDAINHLAHLTVADQSNALFTSLHCLLRFIFVQAWLKR